jgi:hypothetical protein
MMRGILFCTWLLTRALGCGEAFAQDTASEEAARRASVLAHLPPDAAQRFFGNETAPAPGPPEAIGSYERGCLEGAEHCPPTDRTGRSCAPRATVPGVTRF